MEKRWIIISILLIGLGFGQPKWKSRLQTRSVRSNIFHSTSGIFLPTNSTLDRMEFEFDVVHHFFPLIRDGIDALFGLDGPAINRLSLSFAPSDRMLITLARSNQLDNYSLEIKYKIYTSYSGDIPFDIGLYVAPAWNFEVFGRNRTDSKNFQFLGGILFNTMIHEKLGLGFMPGVLQNADIFSNDRITQAFLGIQIQYYITRMLSIPVEFIPVLSNRTDFHTFATGIELEVGGHFFKLFITNNISTNPALAFSGGDRDALEGDLRIGFMITRLLVFGRKK